MEEMFNVRNATNHPVHLTYRNDKGQPVHVTIKPSDMGALPKTEMLTAVLNPFVEHKGEVVPADAACQAEVDKMLPAVKTVKELKDSAMPKKVKPGRDV